MRVGGARVIPVDVRIICATNRNLAKWMESGNFRPDLYYRLNVLPLNIPPLRERKGDILPLAEKFLQDTMGSCRPGKEALKKGLLPALLAHDWPGNVRELKNVMERLTIAASIMPEKSLPDLLRQVWSPGVRRKDPESSFDLAQGEGLKDLTRRFERETIRRLLDEHGQSQARVAELLGISRMSLWRKMQGEENGEGRG